MGTKAAVALDWIIHSHFLPQKDILTQALESAVRMTDSKFGYVHLLDRSEVVEEVYSGIESFPDDKEISTQEKVRISEGEEVQLVLFVGNKDKEYDASEKQVLVFIANEIWQILSRKKIEANLKKREEQLNDAQAMAQMASWELDIPKKIFSYSSQYPVILRANNGEVMDGMSMLSSKIPPKDKESKQLIQEMFNGQLDDGEHELWIQNTGNLQFLHLRCRTIKDSHGNPIQVYGTIQDITEQKQNQIKIQHSEWNLRSIVECSPNGILILRKRKILFGNRSAAKLLEVTLPDLVDKDLARLLPFSEIRAFRAITSELEQRSNDARTFEKQVQLKNGRKKWIGIWTIDIIYDGDIATLVHLFDLSRTKEAELQLLQSEKLATIGQLAAGVAHEINNPVAFVRSNLESLRQYHKIIEPFLKTFHQMTEINDPKEFFDKWNEAKGYFIEDEINSIFDDMKSLAKESLEGVKRVSEIVLEIKSFAHVEKQEGPEDFQINEVIRSSLNWIWNKIKYDCEVDLQLSPNLPLVRGKSQQIGQVLLNIMVNASHAIEERKKKDPSFAPEDSGKPGRLVVGSRLLPKAFEDGTEGIEITIQDNGIGIPAELVSKIFDPFFTTKEVGEGTGLGLSISVDIIKKQGGRISVESEPLKYTRFTIVLVLAPTDSKKEE